MNDLNLFSEALLHLFHLLRDVNIFVRSFGWKSDHFIEFSIICSIHRWGVGDITIAIVAAGVTIDGTFVLVPHRRRWYQSVGAHTENKRNDFHVQNTNLF